MTKYSPVRIMRVAKFSRASHKPPTIAALIDGTAPADLTIARLAATSYRRSLGPAAWQLVTRCRCPSGRRIEPADVFCKAAL